MEVIGSVIICEFRIYLFIYVIRTKGNIYSTLVTVIFKTYGCTHYAWVTGNAQFICLQMPDYFK